MSSSQSATSAPPPCWETEREAALELLRSDAARQRQAWGGGPVLVDALLDDGDPDAAWEAAVDRADDRQWLTLADRLKDNRPADALSVYCAWPNR
jgi:hypothetical protein